MADKRVGQLGTWRFGAQLSLALALLTAPFIRIAGESLLRFDLLNFSFYLAGRPFAIDELYLLLPGSIVFVLFFLLATLVFGRAWCGWGCPQTILTDCIEWFARRIGAKVTTDGISASTSQRAFLHLFIATLALVVAATLLFYFISPNVFFPDIAAGKLPSAAVWFLALAAAAFYIDFAFVRRLLCREFCPYGRFQSALVDAGTLTLRHHPDEASRCLRCGSCVKACPTGIDIRDGYQIECINCGRCLDACRRVMAGRTQAGIIRYTLGTEGKGMRALANGRTLFVAAAFLLAAAVLAAAIVGRQPVSLKLGRPASAPVRALADGRTVNLYSAVVSNRQQRAIRGSLFASDAGGEALEVLGPVRDIDLQPGENRRLDFAVVQPAGVSGGSLRLLLRDRQGRILTEANGALLCAERELKP